MTLEVFAYATKQRRFGPSPPISNGSGSVKLFLG
jgi:hypothetical protein